MMQVVVAAAEPANFQWSTIIIVMRLGWAATYFAILSGNPPAFYCLLEKLGSRSLYGFPRFPADKAPDAVGGRFKPCVTVDAYADRHHVELHIPNKLETQAFMSKKLDK